MLDIEHSTSMVIFIGKDTAFNFGAWRAWEAECVRLGAVVPPEEFKRKMADAAKLAKPTWVQLELFGA